MFIVGDRELEAEVINRHHVFAGEVLEDASEERLSEVETRDPEHGRSPTIYPLLETPRSITMVTTY